MNPCRMRRPALRRRQLTLAVLCLAFSGAAANAVGNEVRDDLFSVFQEHGVTGTFALYDVSADRLTLVNAKRAETRFVPASTFKIANSLIALEIGAVKDENEVIPYGGKPQPIKAWEKDMAMREAIVASNVPVYQELARRVGLESPRVQTIVRDLLRLQTRDTVALYGKTGWQPPIGWWVGWIEKDGKVFTFALNMDLTDMADAPKRITIGKVLLAKLRVL